MKTLLIIATLFIPFSALADHMDVFEFKLKNNCSLSEFLEVVKDFNHDWGEKNSYRAEIAVPIQSDNLVNIYWLGRSASTESFGKAWDTWRNELEDKDSTASKLSKRIDACSENLSRHGYDIY